MKCIYWVLALVIYCETALAQSIDFTISGRIEGAICTPSLSGEGVSGNVLNLPGVALEDLDVEGNTAGDTVVTFSLKGCSIFHYYSPPKSMWVYFHGPADPDGRLIPEQSNQLRFEIIDIESGNVKDIVRVNSPITGEKPNSDQGSGVNNWGNKNADKQYVFRYYANEPVTDVGAMTASVMYTVMYY